MAMNLDALLRIKANVLGEEAIRRLGNSLQGLLGQTKNAAIGFNNLKGAVAGLGAAIAGGTIVGGLSAIVKNSVDAGSELLTLQAKTGLAVNALIAIGNAAKLADVDLETFNSGLTKLNSNLLKAAQGDEDLAQQFKALGVNVKDANGNLVPADKALKQIADRFADMPDGAKKAEVAVALFGKSGRELIPLLNEGAASMEKFTSKLGEDFTARSKLFDRTITELGIKTQGFGLQLTDALLPALQTILEVFSDLFNTDKDFKALFEVIEFAIRGIAVTIYTLVTAVDVLIKNVLAALQAAKQGLAGDFAGAFKTITTRVSSGFAEAKQSIADINKLAFGSAAAPAPRRPGGRPLALDTDTSAADKAADAAAKKRASEQERILEKRAALTKKSTDLQEQLRRSVEDTRDAFEVIGAAPTQKLSLERDTALTENKRIVDDFKKSIKSISDEAVALGGKLDLKIFDGLIEQLERANTELTDQKYLQGLKDLLPSVDEYNAKIAEVSRGKTELTELEKLNAQVNLLQLDILAATNPALAEHVRLLRERAAALDDTNKKQKEKEDSFGANFEEKIKEYYKSLINFGAQVGDALINTFKGLEDQLTNFVTTGKLNFADLANSIIQDIARIAIRQAIIAPLLKGVGGIFGITFADGGVFAQNGIQPFARGGIVDKPTLFPFAKGTGLMGEAGPEAIIPLRRGRDGRLGVEASGSAGSINVTVNVDATGTKAQGDDGRAGQFARAISEAVKNEIVTQKRPGGLLA